MRIIKGKYGRRLIHVPSGFIVRPTTDLAKESLFNILDHHIDFEGSSALDLFSGTGNIAYELVSRGCRSVLSVEKDTRLVAFIQKIADKFGMSELKVMKTDVFRFLELSKTSYDLIFADPPYGVSQQAYEQIVLLIFSKGLLQKDGILVIEHSKDIVLSQLSNFSQIRKYGKVHFSFFVAS